MAYDISQNRRNPAKGKAFQEAAAEILSRHFGTDFEMECPLQIGDPPKDHKFDLVSVDRKWVGECKRYTWTKTGNVPSAKMGFCNEAVFYLSFLPKTKCRFIVMHYDVRPTGHESLAEYYYRTYRHLLGGVFVVELDVGSEQVTQLGKEKS